MTRVGFCGLGVMGYPMPDILQLQVIQLLSITALLHVQMLGLLNIPEQHSLLHVRLPPIPTW